MHESPLGGLRVIELEGAAPFFCGKLFADLGASVVKVEPPGGDPARRLPPLVSLPGTGRLSTSWLSFTLGKQIVVLDSRQREGAGALRELIEGADVLIHGYTAAGAARVGIALDDLEVHRPGLVTVAITPFGYEGPLAEWLGSELVHFAMSGYLYMTGEAEGRPIRPSAPIQSFLHAGNQAFAAALLALRRRRLTGEGAFVDQAIRETGTWMLTHTYQFWDMQRINLRRQGSGRDMGSRKRLKSVYPSADGHIVWMFTTGHLGARALNGLVAWMDEQGMAPQWLRDLDWETVDLLGSAPDMTERLEEVFGGFFASKTGTELLEWAIAHGLMLAPVNTVRDVAHDPQLLARKAWRTIEQPGIGSITVPGPPVRVEGVHWESRGPSPVPLAPKPAVASEMPARAAGPALPLAGVRVLDFGSTLAAPIVGRFLSDFGAEVIKVESQAHPDTLRVGTPYAGGVAGVDRSGYFAAYNAGKRSFALNLQSSEAAAIVEKLVAGADVLIENFAPGVMRRLGFGRKVLHGWNPRLVIASHSLQGQTGPRSRHRGYGQIASAMTGWYDLTGEEGGEPLGPYSAYTDFLSWPLLLSAVLIGIEERDRTGKGQYIDHAQVESSLHFLAPLLLEDQLTGCTHTRCGNREDGLAPNNAYRSLGEDRWVAITVATEGQWRVLCEVLGAPELAADRRFATIEGRKRHEAELDGCIDALTARWDAPDLAARLQAAGVPAGPVARAEDLFSDPQIAHRGRFRRLEHSELGDHAVLLHSFRISGMDAGPWRPAPRLGEHTYEVARDILGLDDEEFARLTDLGVLA
jgi:crotonobetainyl-CoA:carnitine CoA-transferase CaiB-like acyl-CoA transferase